MINWIWAAFIIIGVLYAAMLDVRQLPTEQQPEPVVVMDYEEEAPEGVTLGPGYEDGQGAEIAYDTADGFFVAPLGVEVARNYPFEGEWGDDPETVRPHKIVFWLSGGTEGHNFRLIATDRDGEQFTVPTSVRLSGTTEWRRIEIELSGFQPTPENPGAGLDYPLQLSALVAPSLAAESTDGVLRLDRFEVAFQKVINRNTSYNSQLWMGVVSESVVSYARAAITLALGLIGIMMLWLGLMKIAEAAGLVAILARAVRPIMVLLFPEIPKNSPAMGAILMNVSANMLGLGNAATPLGIKAMKLLQEENPSDEYASNAQCMLLAINTSSITLIPVAIIAFRGSLGSQELFLFWPVMIATTTFSTIVAVITCKILERMPQFQIPAADLARKSLDKKGEG